MSNLDTSLRNAVNNNNLTEIERLLNAGADGEARDKTGMAFLHWAAIRGMPEATKLFVKHGVAVDPLDNGGWTPLHWAGWSGQQEVVKILIDQGGDVNAADYEAFTPLHWAAKMGHKEVFKLFIDSGANIAAPDKGGKTPRDFAKETGIWDDVFTDGARDMQMHRQNAKDMSVNYFKQAMGEATVKLRRVRLNVLGGARRGKTSTVNSLQGKPFVSNLESTEGVQLSVCYLLPGKHLLSDEEIQERIQNESFDGKAARLHYRPRPKSNVTPETEETRAGKCDSTSFEQLNNNVKDIYEKARASLRRPLKFMDLKGNVIRCWDFGGQEECEMAHEMFVSSRSILMFVFNFADYTRAKTRQDEVDVLARWMQTAYSVISEPESVCVVLVGTHRRSWRCSGIDEDHCIENLRKDLSARLSPPVFEAWIRKESKSAAVILTLENETALTNPTGSGLENLSEALTKCSQSIVDSWGEVPWRWLAFVDRLRRRNALFLYKHQVICDAREFPGFTEAGDELAQEVETLLKFFRNLGEVFLFETHYHLLTFAEPEKILAVLRAVIAPEKKIRSRLRDHETEGLREGVLDEKSLKTLWADLQLHEKERELLIEMLCGFDLLLKLQLGSSSQNSGSKKVVAIPALLPQSSGVLSITRDPGELEMSMITYFVDFCPTGLSGVLVAHLHRAISSRSTKQDMIRANAIVLVGKGGCRLSVWIRPEKCQIHWVFVGPREPLLQNVCDVLHEVDGLMTGHLRRRKLPFRHLIPPSCECGADVELHVTPKPFGSGRFWQQSLDMSAKCISCQRSRELLPVSSSKSKPLDPNILPKHSSKFSIFLSHAGEDKCTFVGLLKKTVEAKEPRVQCFLDEMDLPGSNETIQDALEMAINKAKIGVFLLSPEFAAKKWTMWELERFLDRRENAGCAQQKGPGIYPIFFGLTVEDCKDKRLCYREKFRPIFEKHGFFDKKRLEQRTPEKAMDLLRRITKYPGSRREDRRYYHDLADDIANKIVKLAHKWMEIELSHTSYPPICF